MTNPQTTDALARAALAREYGVDAALFPLPGEYDLNFDCRAGNARYVFKIMRAGCNAQFIEMQIAAHESAQQNGLGQNVPAVIKTRNGRTLITLTDADGKERLAFLISWLPGRLLADIDPKTPALAASIGALVARLDKALASIDHPLLDRPQKWNLLEAGWIADRLEVIANPARRERIAKIAARFTKEISPRLHARPRTVVYNDANDMNVLVSAGADGALAASGIFDFGDMVKAPLVCDPAIAMAYTMMGPGDPLARGAALAGAFHREYPLADEEIALLAPLVEMRLAVSVVNAAIEAHERPDNSYLQISSAPAWRLLDYLADIGAETVAAEIAAACIAGNPAATRVTTSSLIARRQRIAPSNQKLFYDDPLRIVRGEKHFLYDADGVQYLDVYNNVPHVGHAHPHVVAAVARQMAEVNTNTRYLQDIHVDYAERMLARLPASLTKIIFLNSASEANELALRLARAATGAKDMIVMDHCYHGATTGAMDISPYKFAHARSLTAKPDWVHVAPQPDLYRGAHRGPDAAARYAEDFRSVASGVTQKGKRIAGFICESLPSVGGQIVLPGGYLKAVYDIVRAAGGVAIADDVQTGLGRLGAYFWGFEQQDALPDIVVMGKPLGNGFPLAAVAMTERIADAFSNGPEFFSTFGGSSASCAAGSAVLDVLRDEKLPAQAQRIGDLMLDGLRALQTRHEMIGDVRGYGFFLGVELVADRASRAPATAAAAQIKNALRTRGILLGVEGPDDNVLKIRPPMSFDDAAADRLLAGLDAAMAER